MKLKLVLLCLSYLISSIQLSDAECLTADGNITTSWSGAINTPNYGAAYPNNQNCQWTITVSRGNQVKLHFIDFELESNSECFDFVQIFDGPDVTSPLILQYCYDYEDIDIVSSSNSITVVFQSDNSMGFRGFYIDYTGVCSGMNISANTSGIIESPNYPNPYPLNVSCDWLLETTYGNKIDIRVLWLDFPISPNCQTDFLSAKDGYSGTSDVIAQLCGNQSDSFSSTDKWMRLGFNSDDVIDNKNYTGFLLEYSNSEITPCEYEPCENNATCTNLFMDYICTCRPGFTGRQCESNIDECDPLPCYNNVTCVDGVNMYTCLCPSGFEGINCEIDIPECLLEPDQPPCHNGGTCLDEINKYSCICTEEFKGPRCKTPANIPMCEAGYDIIEGSGIFWNRTDGDTIDEQPCPPGILGRATRLCVLVNWEPPVAEWDNPQLTYCVSPEFGMLKEKVNNLIESNATAADVLDVTETLRNITFVDVDDGHKKQLYPGDLLISVNTLDVIAYVAMDTENIDTISVSEAFGDSVSNCIDPSVYSVWKNANDEDIVASGATSMVASTELLARGIAQNQTQLMKRRRRRNTEETIQEKIEITSSNLVFVVVVMETPGSLEKWDPSNEIVSRGSLNDSSEIIIPLPASSLQLIMKRDGFVSIFAAKFATIGELYSLYNDTMNDTEDLPVDSRGIQKLNYVNSDVVSGAVLGEDSGSTSLVDPVIIIFEHKEVTGTKNPRCVFMNMNASTLSEQWSSEGCVIQSTNLTHTVCNCYHLTNFALIMDIHNLKEAIPPVHDDILSIISYIGGTLSVLGCVFSVCIYEYFRIWNDRIRVHENLAIAIMTTQLIFLVGIDRTEHFYVCKTVAALLHYFLTALFMWMLIEGINLYVALVKVFGRGSNIKKYLALGWGSPLIVVGVSFGIFYRDYGFGDTCWLPTEIVLIAFAPTVALVIFFNFFILVVVIRVMLNTVTAKEKRQQDELAPIKSGLKATVILFPLLGLTWSFGFLSINTHTLVFTYMFVAFNSLQGIFFFVGHCLRNPDVKKAFERRYGRRNIPSSSGQQQNQSCSSNGLHTISSNLNRTAAAKNKTNNRWSVKLTKINAHTFSNLKDGFDNPVSLRDVRIDHEDINATSIENKKLAKIQGVSGNGITFGNSKYPHVEVSNKTTRNEYHLSQTVLLRDKR